MNYIFKLKSSKTSEIPNKGKLFAFADDIEIYFLPNEANEVEQVINNIEKNGLSTNSSKLFYIAPKNIEILDRIGKLQSSIKYLEIKISYNKIEQIKSI